MFSFSLQLEPIIWQTPPICSLATRQKHTLPSRRRTTLRQPTCLCFVFNSRTSSSAGARPWSRPFRPWQQRRHRGPRGPKPTACPPPPPPQLRPLSPALPRKTRRRSSTALPRRSEKKGDGHQEGTLPRQPKWEKTKFVYKLFLTRFFFLYFMTI